MASGIGRKIGVYPRVGGGTQSDRQVQMRGPGLSPRGRGNHYWAEQEKTGVGSIPAWAGEPAPQAATVVADQVYPRVGGGTEIKAGCRSAPSGLSPRGRGNRYGAWQGARYDGSIPAWAGEPFLAPVLDKISGVYPRVGGGTPSCQPRTGRHVGLSPRGRGNPYFANTAQHILSCPLLVVLNQVHPVGVNYLFRRFAQRPYLLFANRGGVAPRHHD